MQTADLVVDGFDRVRQTVSSVLDGLTPAQLEARPGDGANTIAWLVWHLARVQDDHIASATGTDQAWTADGWFDRFALPFDRAATGYGQRPEEVAAVSGISAELLMGYLDAVHERTIAFVRGLGDNDLDRVVDTRFDPPVTLGVRLVSVIVDDLQHAGQAAYVRGLLG